MLPNGSAGPEGMRIKNMTKFARQLISGTEPVHEEHFRRLVYNFSHYPGTKAKAVATGIILHLVQLLGPRTPAGIQTGAAYGLSALCMGDACNAGNQAQVVDAGAISPLVQLLSSGSEAVRSSAAGALWTTCCGSPDSAAKVAAAGAIPPLMRLLASGSVVAQELIMRVVFTISTTLDTKLEIVEAGIISIVVRLRDSGTKEVADTAWDELSTLFADAGQAPPLAVAIAFRLAPMLRSTSASSLQLAAHGLQLIAQAGPHCQDIVASSGAVPLLVKLLGSKSTDVLSAAIGALRAATTANAMAKHEASSAGALPALMQLLGSKAGHLRDMAADVLLSLCFDPPSIEPSMMPTAPVPLLVQLLRPGSDITAQLAAIHALLIFSGLGEGNRARVVDAGAVPALVRLMEGTSDSVQMLAWQAVRIISDAHQDSVVAAAASVPRLVKLLGSSSPVVQAASAHALANMCCEDCGSVSEAAAAGAVPRLVRLLESESEAVAAAAATAVSFVYNDEAAGGHLGALIPRVLLMMESESPQVQQSAGMAISSILLKAGDRALVAAAAVALPCLVQALALGSAAAQVAAAQMLFGMCVDSEELACQAERAGAIPHLIEMLSGPPLHQGMASGLLSSFTYAEHNQADARPAVVPLVRLLDSPSPVAQENAVKALMNMCVECDAHAVAAAAAGAVPLLTPLLGSPCEGLREPAAFLWWRISLHCRAAIKPACPAAVPVFVRLLGSRSIDEQHRAAGALSNICADADNHALVAGAGAVPYLVHLLSFSSTLVLEEVAAAIKHLSTSASIRAQLSSTQAIAGLVSCLGPWTPPAVQAQTAGALMNLSIHPGNAAAAVGAGAIRPLLNCVAMSCSAEAQAHAAGALWNISIGADSQAKVGAAGAIPLLARRIASTSDPVVQEMVVSALSSLCYQSPVHQSQLARSGAVPALAQLLGSDCGVLREAAATAVVNIAGDSCCQDELVSAGAVPLLVQLLGSSQASLQQKAAGALWNICSADADHHTLVAAAGAVPPLVRLLGSAAAAVKLHAAGALRNIAFAAGNQAAVAAAGAIPALVRLLESKPGAGAQEQAAAALANICCHSKGNEEQAVAAGAITPLLQLLKSTAAGVREQAAAALRNMCHSRPDERVTAALEGFCP